MTVDFQDKNDYPILVIGSAGIDIVGRLKEDKDGGMSNPAEIRTSFGGVARNVTENLALLGQPVALITAVGDDEMSSQLIHQLQDVQVDVSSILKSENQTSASYLAIIDQNGSLDIALDDMRIMESITPKYLRTKLSIFKNSSLLFLDANLSKRCMRTAFSMAERTNLPVCADPASVKIAHRIQPYLDKITILACNGNEAGLLVDQPFDIHKQSDAIEAAKKLVSLGTEISIISLGSLGVCYASPESSGFIPAIRTEIKDPTGSGDAMTAAVLFALINDVPLDDAVRLGVSAASLTLKHWGAVLPGLSLELLYDQLVI